MSYQTSIHFDPTALLIIKNEIDHSIQSVEHAVGALIEEQKLPFNIDDALIQLEQCQQVLALINLEHLALLTQYCAELMRKIMSQPEQINTNDVVVLSEGTTMLKRYIEFVCLQEVKVPQFLLATINRLEKALAKPLSREGDRLLPLLNTNLPELTLPAPIEVIPSQFTHRLYKLCLTKILSNRMTNLDFRGIQLVGAHLCGMSQISRSRSYWALVEVALQHLDQIRLNESRLRTLIRIETDISNFLQNPTEFTVDKTNLADVLSLCISQENTIAQHIRQQLNIADDILSDVQLDIYKKQLFGPDFETIHTVSHLIIDELSQIRNHIELKYEQLNSEQVQDIKNQLNRLAQVLRILNLNESSQTLREQTYSLELATFRDEIQITGLMNALLNAINSVAILARQYVSQRLQLRINNTQISLDHLDDAFHTLVDESKQLIEKITNDLNTYCDDSLQSIEHIPSQLKELSGSALFLNQLSQHQALQHTANFLYACIESKQIINVDQINVVFNVLASLDMLLDNLKNKQPVLERMFEIALESSQKLQHSEAA